MRCVRQLSESCVPKRDACLQTIALLNVSGNLIVKGSVRCQSRPIPGNRDHRGEQSVQYQNKGDPPGKRYGIQNGSGSARAWFSVGVDQIVPPCELLTPGRKDS